MDHKSKHKLAFIRNRRTQLIVQHAEQHKDQVERNAEIQAALNAPSPTQPEDDEPVWSAKTREIKMKTRGRSRMARERWIQFAGSTGGIGR